MSDYYGDHYTPALEELKAAWAHYHSEVDISVAEAEFDRTMDEFGNEMYEDGYSEGYSYGIGEFYPGEKIDGPRSL